MNILYYNTQTSASLYLWHVLKNLNPDLYIQVFGMVYI